MRERWWLIVRVHDSLAPSQGGSTGSNPVGATNKLGGYSYFEQWRGGRKGAAPSAVFDSRRWVHDHQRDDDGGPMTFAAEPLPPPPVPPPARRRGVLVAAIAGGVAVLVAAAVLITLAVTGGSADPALGWGHDATREIGLLKLVCPTIATTSSGTAACRFSDGNVAVSTSSDATSQGFLVAILEDRQSPAACEVVAKGFIVGANNASILREATGDVHAFANRYGGYTEGAC